METRKLIMILTLVLFGIGTFAQRPDEMDDMSEKFAAQKVAYITRALDLTPDESAAFWPLYNEYEKKRKQLQEEMKNYKSTILDKEAKITDEEAIKALDFIHSHMNKMNELEEEYHNKYLKVIPAHKVLLLLKAEKDFRRQLLKQLGEKRNQKGGRD